MYDSRKHSIEQSPFKIEVNYSDSETLCWTNYIVLLQSLLFYAPAYAGKFVQGGKWVCLGWTSSSLLSQASRGRTMLQQHCKRPEQGVSFTFLLYLPNRNNVFHSLVFFFYCFLMNSYIVKNPIGLDAIDMEMGDRRICLT